MTGLRLDPAGHARPTAPFGAAALYEWLEGRLERGTSEATVRATTIPRHSWPRPLLSAVTIADPTDPRPARVTLSSLE
ncbi:MAG TPA: hypothetical protein VII33_14650 [Nakamurella sp.]